MENKIEISCPQEKCVHNQIGYGVGCRKCAECGCKPNIIDQNCDRCLSCSTDDGVLRWDDSILGRLKNNNKEIEVEIK